LTGNGDGVAWVFAAVAAGSGLNENIPHHARLCSNRLVTKYGYLTQIIHCSTDQALDQWMRFSQVLEG
jgi:hypothetical protein